MVPDTTLDGVIIILVAVGLALALQRVVRRMMPPTMLAPHLDVAGIMYAALSVVIAVLLGQVVIAAWDDYTIAEESVDTEASSLINLYRLADGWEPPEQTAVQEALIYYASDVIQNEWPRMASGDADLQPGDYPPMVAIWRAVSRMNPDSDREIASLQIMLSEVTSLEAARSQRLLLKNRSLPPLLWTALIGGAVITIGFSFLLAVDDPLLQGTMLAVLTALMALLLFLVYTMEHPFEGANGIKPEPFEIMLVLTRSDPPPLETPVATPGPEGAWRTPQLPASAPLIG